MSIEDKLAKAAELEALAAKLRAEVEADRVKKWEPKGGAFTIMGDGACSFVDSVYGYKVFGVERNNEKQAEKDASRMRKFNRLLCWMIEQGWDGELEVFQHAGGEVVISFNDSENLSDSLMYGIANGSIDL